FILLIMLRPPPRPTLFPYTTLFRSRQVREDAAKQVLEKLRNRIDKFNVAEPTIARQGEDRILIQLPGIQDIQRAKDLIGKTGYLDRKSTRLNSSHRTISYAVFCLKK